MAHTVGTQYKYEIKGQQVVVERYDNSNSYPCFKTSINGKPMLSNMDGYRFPKDAANQTYRFALAKGIIEANQ